MANKHPRPEDARVVERVRPPKWRTKRERPEQGGGFRRQPDAAHEDETSLVADRFLAGILASGDPMPERQQVVDRVRHLLRHAKPGHETVVLVSSPVPPYFGATVAAGRGVEVVEDE